MSEYSDSKDRGGLKRPTKWERVWHEELDQVKTRRDRHDEPGAVGNNTEATDPAADSEVEAKSAAQRASEMDLVGLAFSGGGIRSATFNLGVLQGLAEQKLLKNVDYLSTVSGGGYIGGWFGAWVSRQAGGLAAVQKMLQPVRRKQPDAAADSIDRGSELADREPEPVAHLRAYSNYLAPRVSMLSRDSLSLIAAYTRNLTASLLVLLPALAACVAGARLLHWCFVSETFTGIHCINQTVITLTVLFSAVAYLMITMSLGRIRDVNRYQQGEQIPPSRRVHLSPGVYRVLVLILTTAVVLAVWLLSDKSRCTWIDTSESKQLLPFGAVGLAFVFGLLSGLLYFVHELLQGFLGFRLWSLIAKIVAGSIGGLMLFAAEKFQFGREANETHDFVLGVPLLLFTFIGASKIDVGLSGRDLSDEEREWWGQLCAALARVGIIWLIGMGVIFFGPCLIDYIGREAAGVVTGGWLVSTVAGLIAGRSQGTQKPGRLKRILVAAVPYVFVIGLGCLLSLGVSVLVNPDQQVQPKTGGRALAMMDSRTDPDSRADQDETTLKFNDLFIQHEQAFKGTELFSISAVFLFCLLFSAFASRRIDVNDTSLNGMYANRLTRCYLGATRAKQRGSQRFGKAVSSEPPRRQPHPWTGFDPLDDVKLSDLKIAEGNDGYDGPIHLFNTAINLAGGEDLTQQDRMANSFTLTPSSCGNANLGFRPTKDGDGSFAGGLTIGRSIAISGAAANPNMGYRTSPAMAALMTLFNVRLGWWVGNPHDSRRWKMPGPPWALGSLVVEMMSGTDSNNGFVNLSDGGHFENLGVYELVRRRCRYIIVVDAGADPDYEFADLGNLVRKCRIDFGVDIEIDIDPLRPDPETGLARWHCAVGHIRYDQIHHAAALGTLVYLKPVLTGDEPADLTNYARENSPFPQQPTADQFFSESQFESYRELGHHTAKAVLADAAKLSRTRS